MEYTFVMGENSVTLFNVSNGNKVTVFNDDKRFDQFKSFIAEGDYESAENMDVKVAVSNFCLNSHTSSFNVKILDGVGVVNCNGKDYPLANAIVNRIVRMQNEGFSAQPLVNFLERLYNNPSKTAIDELFLFLESTDLPITYDGYFIAYKIVKEDFKDIYTGKLDNSVGQVLSMPRFEVDDKRSNTCSSGLHFCSRTYLANYGSSKQDTDKCVLVKIDPADVVSIPSDYNNAKGRTCKYEVVGVMKEDDWKAILATREYTSSAVVDVWGTESSLDDAYDESDDFDDSDDWQEVGS
jgi:hypothetical protein